MYHLARCQ